jgi:hypothetical protein
MATVDEAVYRLKGIYLEVPGTRLTFAEAVSVSGLDPSICREVLAALMDAGFLKRTSNDAFIRP